MLLGRISFTPKVAYKSSKFFRLYLLRVFSNAGDFIKSFIINPCFLASLSRYSLPFSILSSLLDFLYQTFILLLALLLFAILIQSILGPVRIR